MRRVFVVCAVAVCAVAVLAVTACTAAPSASRDRHPSVSPSPTEVPPPVVGACYGQSLGQTNNLIALIRDSGMRSPVDCAKSPHVLEVVYVGTFEGDAPGAASPPANTSAALILAYRRCQQALSDYLGGDWHTAAVWPMLVAPGQTMWNAGKRWYHCDAAHLPAALGDSNFLVDTGSIKDGLRGSRPLLITCVTTDDTPSDHTANARATDCAQSHTEEYAGVYTAPTGPWLGYDDAGKLAQRGCQGVVARYLGFASANSGGNDQVGWLTEGFIQDRWELGDRSTRCYAYAFTGTKRIVGSVKGIRDRAPRAG